MTNNKVAEQLQSAISTAPFLIEKERYQLAVDEITRLQDIVDKSNNTNKETKNYQGDPWYADDSADTVRFMRGNFQVFKAPKHSTDYEEYWPSPLMIKWMLDTMNIAESNGNLPPVHC